jgi:hypothetical protein
VQHALRAFTPRDQKAVKAAAGTFRPNPKLDTEAVITQLGVGEALASMLDDKGMPTMVEQAAVLPPCGQIGPITAEQRAQIIKQSLVFGRYEQAIDRESAYEILKARAEKEAQEQGESGQKKGTGKEKPGLLKRVFEAFATSTARRIATAVSKAIVAAIAAYVLGGGKKRK